MCVLMVEGMSVLVNVTLSLMSVMSPPPALCNLFVFDSVYVDLQYDEISLTFTTGSECLCGVCSHVVVFGLSVRLSWYPIWMRWLM